MRTRPLTMLFTVLVASSVAWLAPFGVQAAHAASHPSLNVTLSTTRTERGNKVSVKFCWKNAERGWTAQLTSADAPEAVPSQIFLAPVTVPTQCVNVLAPTSARGVHPIMGQLVTPGAVQFVTAVSFLYVYAPVAGSVFLKHVLHPDCHGSGTVVVGTSSYKWTCSMKAVTSHLTVVSTTCRNAHFTLASTDEASGNPSSPGRSVFELAQNVIKPSFKEFRDNVVVAKSLPLSGSAFWVAFKSTHPSSRLYFLDKGASADCYTSTGIA